MDEKNTLNILWTDKKPETSLKIVMQYAADHMRKMEYDQVTVTVCATAAKVGTANPQARQALCDAIAAGVRVTACVACIEELDTVRKLKALGIELGVTGKQSAAEKAKKKTIIACL